MLARVAGVDEGVPLPPLLAVMLTVNLIFFAWRAVLRYAFTAREYGRAEGLWAVLRIPVANIIAIMAGSRAFANYLRSLSGGAVRWDKTAHDIHPAMLRGSVAA